MAFFSLKSFWKGKANVHVILKLNKTTVAYISKKRGTISKCCNELTAKQWEWANKQSIWFTTYYAPGTKNAIADLQSWSSSIINSGL